MGSSQSAATDEKTNQNVNKVTPTLNTPPETQPVKYSNDTTDGVPQRLAVTPDPKQAVRMRRKGYPQEIPGSPARMSRQGREAYYESLDDHKRVTETILNIRYQDYEFPFENLVFEGGGAKGQVYIGCLKVLEEIGLKPKRLAGASAGAICSALVAVGYNADELEEILEMNLDEVLLDHSCGKCSFLPNLIGNFGWNPGERFLSTFGELIARKVGDPDITFKQLFQVTGKELCITAVNVNLLAVEYFHPKTTPNMSVRLAVRMSLSIPGVFQPVKVKNGQGQTDVYIDGGLLCNYPIHAFDGWWLSMKKENSFLNKIQPLDDLTKFLDKKERFGKFNTETLGFLVYSSLEQDLMQAKLDERVGTAVTEGQRPEHSALYRAKAHAMENKEKAVDEHRIYMGALGKFLELAGRVNKNKALNRVNGTDMAADDVIDKMELKQTLQQALDNSMCHTQSSEHSLGIPDDLFTYTHVEILFGAAANLDTIFDDLDKDDSGYISYDELINFVERSGIDIQSKFQGYGRCEIESLSGFATGVLNCLLTNVTKMYLEERDIERTVGINTDYIGTTDFKMEDYDREFCVQQGRKATISFLRHYVHEKNPPRKEHAGGVPSSAQRNGVGVGRLGGSQLNPPITPKLNLPSSSEPPTPRTKRGTSLPPIRGTENKVHTLGSQEIGSVLTKSS